MGNWHSQIYQYLFKAVQYPNLPSDSGTGNVGGKTISTARTCWDTVAGSGVALILGTDWRVKQGCNVVIA